MSDPLKVLILEDQPDDAELMVRQLRKASFLPCWERVETRQEFLGHLDDDLQLILADYHLPQFSAPEALELLHQQGRDVPFLVVSGDEGDDTAVECLRDGADDYVQKDQSGRLGEAVRSALVQKELRDSKRRTEQHLLESEQQFKAVFDQTFQLMLLLDPKGRVFNLNATSLAALQLQLGEAEGQPVWELPNWSDHSRRVLEWAVRDAAAGDTSHIEVTVRRGQREVTLELSLKPVENVQGEIELLVGEGRDISDLRRTEKALHGLAVDLSKLRGDDFFQSLARQMITALEADVVLVGELLEENSKIRALTAVQDGAPLENFSYALKGTPCENVVGGHVCVHPAGVAERFPEDLLLTDLCIEGYAGAAMMDSAGRPMGLVLCLQRAPISDPELVGSLIRIFAARAAGELERNRAEKALRASEERYRRYYEKDFTGVYTATPDGQLLDCNAAFAKIFGFDSPEHAVATPISAIYEDYEKREPYIERIRQDGILEGFETTLRHLDGHPVHVRVNVFGRFDDAGQLVEYEGHMLDETEWKQSAERTLEQAALLDEANDAIAVQDLEGRIVFWNRAAEALYGWSKKEALERHMSALLFFEGDPTDDQARAITLERGDWVGELQHRSRECQKMVVESRWNLVRDSSGQPKSILVISTDVTERRELEEHLLRSQRLESIGQLAGGIAHDLNNILAPILLSIDFLKKGIQDETSRKILVSLDSSARRGMDMVKQVLWFARGVKGERAPLDPQHLIREVEKISRDTFPRSIEIDIDVEASLQEVSGDATQLYQVLMNLCLNARDAMPMGGRLSVGARNVALDEGYARMRPEAQAGPHVVIDVADTGTGIPSELIDRVFEPFFTTKSVGHGTGLGLSTVHSIIKSHGGFVDVSSRIGEGTTFSVYLPVATEPMLLTEAHAEPSREMPQGHGELILVADDETAIREVTAETLESNGYRALVASDGAEAVALLAEHRGRVAVTLTDMSMPVMDGLATIRALRKLDPELKIIACSGLNDHEGLLQKHGQEVEAVLTKPFTAHKLLEQLDRLLH